MPIKNLSEHCLIKHLYKRPARVMQLSRDCSVFLSSSAQLVPTHYAEMFPDTKKGNNTRGILVGISFYVIIIISKVVSGEV